MVLLLQLVMITIEVSNMVEAFQNEPNDGHKHQWYHPKGEPIGWPKRCSLCGKRKGRVGNKSGNL